MGTMQQFLASRKVSRVPKREDHIRWNCEMTPGESDKKRLHLVVAHGSDPRGYIEKILGQLRGISFVEPVRQTFEGTVSGSDTKFIFESYDTGVDPAVHVNWTQFGLRTKRDPKLFERKGYTDDIVAYVSSVYVGKVR